MMFENEKTVAGRPQSQVPLIVIFFRKSRFVQQQNTLIKYLAMKHMYKIKWKFSLVCTAFIFLGLSTVYAQPASLPPFVKYAVNNFSSIAKAACDTCVPEVSAPLQQFRPIPFPEAGPIKLATGIDVSAMPGLMVPNFWGGGSPEIKGYMAKVAGIHEE